MNIVVIGAGYVGLVTATCLAQEGHQVTCIDQNKEKIRSLQKGVIPFFEPGLSSLVLRNQKSGRLHFAPSLESVVPSAEIIFLAVGTPSRADGSADISQIMAAVDQLSSCLKKYTIIVNKSTVPVGTAQKVKARICAKTKVKFDVVSNPEFLREGSAVHDVQNPERIVIGSDSSRAQAVMLRLYREHTCPKVCTNFETSEMIKYTSNAFLATKISFINEIARVCEEVGADVTDVAKGVGLDKRIGPHFLQAGLGYGGSCFPKDVRALHHIADRNGYAFELLTAVIRVNNQQRRNFFEKIKKRFPVLRGRKFAIWGLAFKPNTDDMRESVAIDIITLLLAEGAQVHVYDPAAIPNAHLLFGNRITYAKGTYDCLTGADALVIITEWDIFRKASLSRMRSLLKKPVIFDGRNIFDPGKMNGLGFDYYSIGRKKIKAASFPAGTK